MDGLYTLFAALLNRSLTSAPLLLAAILVRPALTRLSRRAMWFLWVLTAVRLILPAPRAPLSVFGFLGPAPADSWDVPFFRVAGLGVAPTLTLNLNGLAEGIGTAAHAVMEPVRQPSVYLPPLMRLWALGVGAVAAWAAVSCVLLRRRLSEAVPLRDNVWVCDGIRTPFVYGLVRPKIYIPSGTDETGLPSVLAHERAHIRRRDYIWKPLGFVLLTLHWFDPLVWLGYVLFCRDTELACDEAVLRNLDREGRRAYCEALLSLSDGRRDLLVHPVAFGETGIRERVRRAARYRRPTRWAACLSVLLCALIAAGFSALPSGGLTAGHRRTVGASAVYSRADIESAMDEAERAFQMNFSGCVLRSLTYDEARCGKANEAWAASSGANQAIVLTSDFYVISGDGSLEERETYRNWQWILTRDDGPWTVITWGYG